MRKLPKELEWFSLKKYDICANWGFDKWFGALRARFQLQEDLKQLPTLNLIDSLNHILEIEYYDKYVTIEKLFTNSGRHLFSAVEPMSLHAAFLIHDEIGKWMNGHENASSFKKSLRESDEGAKLRKELINSSYDEAFIDSWSKYFDYSYIILGRAHVTVDLNLSDDALIEQFAACISNMRERLKWYTARKTITNEDLHEWHIKKLLPYIDIAFYNDIYKCGLTDKQFGEILFPSEYDRDLGKHIAETIRPNALNLLTRENINALQGQLLKQNQKPAKNGGRPKKKSKPSPRSKI
ncbi:DUF6387 family protein [Methylomagnum sp.]